MQIETSQSWPEANARLRQVRAAGYKAQATNMGEYIVIHISPGKHADLARLPVRKVIDLVPRQEEAKDISSFIDAHGGKLSPFRGYRMKSEMPPDPEKEAPK